MSKPKNNEDQSGSPLPAKDKDCKFMKVDTKEFAKAKPDPNAKN